MKKRDHDAWQTDIFNKSVKKANYLQKIHFDTKASKYEFSALSAAIGNITASSVLDIGAGTGRFTIPLARLARKVTAIDLSEESITILNNFAKNEHLTNIRASVMDFRDVPHIPKYDLALMVNLIHHVEDANALFEKIKSILTHKGSLVIFEFNPLNPLFYPMFLLTGQLTIHLTKEYFRSNRWQLCRLLVKAGFRVEKVYRHAFFPTRLVDVHPVFISLNRWCNQLPFVQEFCAFHIYVCKLEKNSLQ